MLGCPKWAQIDKYIQIFSIDISMIQIYSVRIVFLIYLDICLSIQMPHSVWTKHMQFTELDHKLLWDDQNSKKKSTVLPAKFLLTSNAMQWWTVPPLIWSGNEEADLCKKWDCNREIISDNGEFWSKAISVILNQYGHMPAQNNIWKQQKINFEDSKNLFSH